MRSNDTETIAQVDPAHVLVLDDIFGRAAHQYLAVVQDVGAVDDLQGFLDVVVCDEHADAPVFEVGDEVAEEDPVVILESMKMEIPVGAPAAGRVAEILVEEGEAVEEGQEVAVIEA